MGFLLTALRVILTPKKCAIIFITPTPVAFLIIVNVTIHATLRYCMIMASMNLR